MDGVENVPQDALLLMRVRRPLFESSTLVYIVAIRCANHHDELMDVATLSEFLHVVIC